MAETNWNLLIYAGLIAFGIYFKEKLIEIFDYIFKELPIKLYPSNGTVGLIIVISIIAIAFYWLSTRD